MGKTRAAARQEKRRVRVGFTDMTFTLVVLLLLAMGIVMMFSASYAIAQNEDKPGYFYALRQVIFGGIGLVMMTIMSFVYYHIWMKKGFAIAVYLAANENAVPFYEKLGMERADDVMKYWRGEWTDFTVE